jgi:SAM-dependent methyltransferase
MTAPDNRVVMKSTLALRPFEDPELHRAVSEIIRRHSSNRQDPREFALGDTDLSGAGEVLDLGCGFGFMTGALTGRLRADARITGVDACAANEAPFLDQVAAAGYRGTFRALMIGPELPWPPAHFDLVLCTYALYFFVEALPEVARVLVPAGRLLVLTHDERSFTGLLSAAGIPAAGSLLRKLVARFCTGNAGPRLRHWFRVVERRDYPNTLRFGPADLEDLLAYVAFKLPLLAPDVADEAAALARMRAAIERRMAVDGAVTVEKDDSCYWCRRPRRPRPRRERGRDLGDPAGGHGESHPA